jgi:hypothetical protein
MKNKPMAMNLNDTATIESEKHAARAEQRVPADRSA